MWRSVELAGELSGVMLALQANLISRDALIEVLHEWALDRDRQLLEIAQTRGALSPEARKAVEQLLPADAQVQRERGAAAPPVNLAVVSGAVPRVMGAGPVAAAARPALPPPRPPLADNPYVTIPPEKLNSLQPVSRYQIVRPHRAGGLAEVFVAIDDELHREVALKQILEAHADDPDSRARFLFEAEITASLEHPSIVPIYGRGQYADGRPYYAMRFIEGETLQESIDRYHESNARPDRQPGEQAMELRTLLRRFIAVCEAVEYAHSRGILHCDLKPTNIIIGDYGETSVLDWGLAHSFRVDQTHVARREKLGSSSRIGDSNSPSQSSSRGVAGTPHFMSPEQAHGRADRLGPTSDVYSLGATLYCILVGHPPFSDLGDSREVLKEVRKGSFKRPRELKKGVSHELEAICLKSMAYDQAQRYGSARALLVDVEHWLADEPVLAYPESWAHRVQRFVRHHKTASVATLATLLVLAVVLGWLYVVGQRRALAEERAREIERQAEREKQFAADHARDLEREADRALRAIENVFNGVSTEEMLDDKSLQPVRSSLLQYYQEYLKERGSDPAAQLELAKVNERMSKMTKLVGTKQDALDYLDRAKQVYEKLLAAQPSSVDYQARRAHNLVEQAGLLFDLGRNHEAEKQYEVALKILIPLAEQEPDNNELQRYLADAYHNFAILLPDVGQRDKSLEYLKLGLVKRDQLLRRDPLNATMKRDLAISYGYLGDALLDMDQEVQAKDAYDSSERYRRELVEKDSTDLEARFQLARSYENTSFFYRRRKSRIGSKQGDFEEAKKLLTVVRDMREVMVREKPANSRYRQDLGWAYLELGEVDLDLGKADEAATALKEAEKTFNELVTGDAHDNTSLGPRARCRVFLAIALIAQADTAKSPADAEKLKAEALKVIEGAEADFSRLKATNSETFYQLAVIESLRAELSPEDPDQRQARALAWIERSLAEGFKDWARWSEDRGLKSIRKHPKFESLLEAARRSLKPPTN